MKKFILLLLILPLTLMARPEKRYLQKPVPSILGIVKWSPTTNCTWNWTNTGDSWYTADLADDDCDDNARTKYGDNNITDVTCTDGAAGGCDGAYFRIKIRNVKKGIVKVIGIGSFYATGTNKECYWGFYDGTSTSINMNHNHNTDAVVTPQIIGYFIYEKDQGDVTYSIALAEYLTSTCSVLNDPLGGVLRYSTLIVEHYNFFDEAIYFK